MKIVDKHGLLADLAGNDNIVLELGCGSRKRHSEAIGIDARDLPGVDIVGDALSVLRELPAESVSTVHSYHFFEHVNDFAAYMVEMNRVMKKSGQLHITTPHFSNPYYYSDCTHRTPFGLYSLSYFCDSNLFRRRVPVYHPGLRFDLVSVDLIFKASPPFYLRWGVKKVFQFLFNSSSYMKELYEESFCYLIPCYEVRYELVKL